MKTVNGLSFDTDIEIGDTVQICKDQHWATIASELVPRKGIAKVWDTFGSPAIVCVQVELENSIGFSSRTVSWPLRSVKKVVQPAPDVGKRVQPPKPADTLKARMVRVEATASDKKRLSSELALCQEHFMKCEVPAITEATDSNGRAIKIKDRVRILMDLDMMHQEMDVGKTGEIKQFFHAGPIRMALIFFDALNSSGSCTRPTRSLVFVPPAPISSKTPLDNERIIEIRKHEDALTELERKWKLDRTAYHAEKQRLLNLLGRATVADPKDYCQF